MKYLRERILLCQKTEKLKIGGKRQRNFKYHFPVQSSFTGRYGRWSFLSFGRSTVLVLYKAGLED
jgi:hypothetical protein